jgi:hypothetical protein
MIDRLRQILSKRTRGYWGLIATAAGDAQSVQMTSASVSALSLARGSHGDAVAPSIVSESVEALAAYSPNLLVQITGDWLKPAAIYDNPWWTAAWTAALRHLKVASAITLAEVDVPVLASEVAIVWSHTTSGEVSWHEVVSDLRAHRVFYRDVRAMSLQPLGDLVLSASDVSTAPWPALRLLRGRIACLEIAAREALDVRAREWRNRSPMDAALAAELSAELSPSILDELRADVLAAVPGIEDARLLIPFVYVLMGGWRAP